MSAEERAKRIEAGLHAATVKVEGYRTLEAKRSAFLVARGPIGWKKTQAYKDRPREPKGRTVLAPSVWYQHVSGTAECSWCGETVHPGQRRWSRKHETMPRVLITRCATCGKGPG